ncbi:MAG: glycoside hydrolase family 2 protein [Phycisphaerales bacterium]|nr:glycoside hydrolase family 2 protein [Phycisphaerales bacterium]
MMRSDLRTLRIGCVTLVLGVAGLARAEDAVRRVVDVNAGWRFHKGDVESAGKAAFDDKAWESVDLPHTWNAQDGQDGGNNYYRGPGWYRRSLGELKGVVGKRVFIRFQAANTVADVYLNGAHVGQHRGGFAAFCFELSPHLKADGANVLAVRVDNSHFDDVPPWSADFTFFGGIYRGVELLVLDPVCISPLDYASPGVYLQMVGVGKDWAKVQLTTVISNGQDKALDAKLDVELRDADDKVVLNERFPVELAASAEARTQHVVHIDNPHMWNGRRDPYLYSVTVRLLVDDKPVDEVHQPLGLRTFGVDREKGFVLNDTPLDLHGVNRHQDRLDMGWAITQREHDEDFALIREMGCTAVRLAHYQQADYAYTLCDGMGLVVWAEIPLVNRIADTPEFRDNCRQQLRELIRQNYNHPSICFWGIHNEITAPWDQGPDATALVRDLAALAKAEDPTRLTTCAACDPVDHPANWQTNVVAVNRYFGWYAGEAEDVAAWADATHKAHPQTPVGMSEYGAGASIHHHAWPPVKPKHNGPNHPEEWQAHLHEVHWRAMRERPFLWCKFVWNMFDFAVDARNEGDTPGRNDKGLVTYDRKTKKDAFYWYKANWSDEPFVHINSSRYEKRTTAQTTIRVYTNCDEVELQHNGKSLGKQKCADHVCEWPVTLEPGTNEMKVKAIHDGAEVVDSCQWMLALPSSDGAE